MASRRSANIYDFDFTLSEEYQQMPLFRDHAEAILKKHGVKPEEYFSKLCGEKVDVGVGALEQLLRDRDIFTDFSNESLERYGHLIKLSPGLPDWFTRTTSDANSLGLDLEHHIVSAGCVPLIRGTPLAPFLHSIRAGRYVKDQQGWRIGSVVEPSNKTDEIKKICKGQDLHQNVPVNGYHVNYDHVCVFGDGQSDRRKMNFIREVGGWSIGVYKKGDEADFEKAKQDLFGLVHFIVPRDYSKDSHLNIVYRRVQESIANLSCNFDYRNIHKLLVGHARHPQETELATKHLANCNDCQERSKPTEVYF